MNKFNFEEVNVVPEVHLLMEGEDMGINTEFEAALGQVSPYVIKRVIDMLNHMMVKLCISGSMGGTGGTRKNKH